MNKQEILRHLSGFCSDITVDAERYVYADNNFLCGLEIMDDAIGVFYPHRNKEKIDLYTGIDNYEDIVSVWAEYRDRAEKISKRMRKAELEKLLQGTV